ncbi:MAG: DOMON-like domain-containing protein [Cyanosarcina radialis HA8281-LM2]|jgi:hypothetical protein|nr:DOMON-like domain-containing protein [Cyanosarcina radialis HA8281-LM2]
MNDRSFSLQPFPGSSPLPDIEIAGKIARHSNTLTIAYQLVGTLAEIAIASPSARPARKHELWEETCFEFFIATPNSSQYWEFNLSPAGDWNVYRFASYRAGMEEEMAFELLPFSVQTRSNAFLLDLKLNLDPIVSPETNLQIAISTVIKSKNGDISYWALTHPGVQADFHHPDGFAIALSN